MTSTRAPTASRGSSRMRTRSPRAAVASARMRTAAAYLTNEAWLQLEGQLSPAQRRQDHDLRAVAHAGGESLPEVDVLAVDEDVQVRAQLAALGQHAVAKRR